MLTQILGTTIDEDRHRGGSSAHARHRASLEAPVERSSLPARMGAAFMHAVRRDRHTLTSYPCRLPNGKIGVTAVVLQGGEWTLVCRVA